MTTSDPARFASRLDRVETSAIRELFKLLGRPGIVSFAGGFPDAALFDVEGVAAAADRALKENGGAALQYGATEGWTPLRESLAAIMRARGADVSPEGLIVTTGSQQGLDLVAKTMIDDGDVVLVEAPTFLAAIQAFRLYGADVRGVPVDADGIRVDALEAAIGTHRPKLLYLVPNFGNPSGAMLSPERRLRVLELAARHGVRVIEDDPYGELWFDAPPPPSLLALSDRVPGSRERLIHLGSLSKVLAPGLRVGWMIAPADLLSRAVMVKQFADAHTSTFAQLTADAYLRAGRLDAAVQRVRAAYGKRARLLCERLRAVIGPRLDFRDPAGGMFVWGRLEGVDVPTLAPLAIEEGVAFVPGVPFYADGADASTLRLSFATSDEARITEGVDRLGRALARFDAR